MKKAAAVIALLAVSGCAVYPAAPGVHVSAGVRYGPPPVVYDPPAVVYAPRPYWGPGWSGRGWGPGYGPGYGPGWRRW